MIRVFDFVKKLSDLSGSYAREVFLFMNIVIWCAVSAVIFVPLCSILIKNDMVLFTSTICLVGYPGIIIGLFGGILYLVMKS